MIFPLVELIDKIAHKVYSGDDVGVELANPTIIAGDTIKLFS